MQDIFQGFVDKENREVADHMRFEEMQNQMQDAAAQETPGGEAMTPPPAGGEASAPAPTI
jgi:hypothetical protein